MTDGVEVVFARVTKTTCHPVSALRRAGPGTCSVVPTASGRRRSGAAVVAAVVVVVVKASLCCNGSGSLRSKPRGN